MVSIYFYPDKPKAPKTVLMVWVSPFGIRASTGLSINPKYWLKDKVTVTNKHPRYEYIRTKLAMLDGKIFQEATGYEDKPAEFTKEVLQRIIDPNKTSSIRKGIHLVSEWFDKWRWPFLDNENRLNHLDKNAENNLVYQTWKKQMQEKERQKIQRMKIDNQDKIKGLNTLISLRTTINWLIKFNPDIRASDINPEILQDVYTFLSTETQIKENSSLRVLQNNIRKILKAHHLPHDWIEMAEITEAETFDLEWPEVLKLKSTYYSRPELAEAAHTFVINCQICLRWSDLSALSEFNFIKFKSDKHVKYTGIKKKQIKTEYGVHVPIPPMAQELIDVYGGIPLPKTLKGDYSNYYYRLRLKDAAKEAGLDRLILYKNKSVPLYEVLSGHNARHTGASRLFEATRNDALKEKLLGHKFKNDPYTKVAPAIIAEELLDAWSLIEAKYKDVV